MKDKPINVLELLDKDLNTLTREELMEVAKYNASKILKSTNKITFDVNEGEYVGRFTFRLPSLMDEINIAVRQSELSQGKTLQGVIANNVVFMFATLETVCEASPDWFSLDKISDYKVLDKIYTQYDNEVSAIRGSHENIDGVADESDSDSV